MAYDSDEILRHLPHPIADRCRSLPADWTLNHLVSLVGDDSPICYGILMPGDHHKNGVPVIKVKNFHAGKIDASSLLRTTKKIDHEYRRSRVATGDLLLSIRGSVGELAIVEADIDGANITQDTARIRLTRKANRRYIFYALQSGLVQRQIDMNTIGQAVKGINISEVRRLVVPAPPLPEQQKIASILSAWDRAIELTEKLITAKQNLKQALMQQLLTGKVRFKEFVKSENRQKTPIGEMPSEWKSYRLGRIVERVKRKNPEAEVHVLTASGEHGLVDQRKYFNRSVSGADLSGYYLLKRGEFAYNRSAMKGYPFGAIKRLNRYAQGVLSTLYICFGITDDRCDSDYMCQFFEARLLDRQLRGITHVGGRAHGLLNITNSDFYSMLVVLPSIAEQQKIAAVLDAQDIEIDGIRRMIDILKQQKKGVMQQLLTGKIRVDVDKISV